MIQPQKVLHLYLEKEKKRTKFGTIDYLVSEKHDGWYITIDYDASKGTYESPRSSSGRLIPSLSHISDILNKTIKPTFNLRLIAEAIIPGMEFSELNGILNRSVGDCEAKGVVFIIHDLLRIEKDSIVPRKAIDRLSDVQQFLYFLELDHIFKESTILSITNEEPIMMKYAESIWDNDGEGVVLKAIDEIYYPGKRNHSLLKIKLEETEDMFVDSIYTTIGEKGNENLNARCRFFSSKISDYVEVDVRVGKVSDVEILTKIKQHSLNRLRSTIVEIKYMKELENGSLREPRFKKIRWDLMNFGVNDI